MKTYGKNRLTSNQEKKMGMDMPHIAKINKQHYKACTKVEPSGKKDTDDDQETQEGYNWNT